MDTAGLIAEMLAGRRRALARLLSAVEAGEQDRMREVMVAIHPHTGGADTIGITGPPGVGKSTLTNELVTELRRQGRTVGVIAVDPSSPYSGGALLGDRVRMSGHTADAGVYIRSMASRGHLGGLGWTTPQAVAIMDAAGFDVVVVETVGVGQAEVEIAALTDCVVVVLAPGMGDGVQAAKAGILEVADVFVVNKADHAGAQRTAAELRAMQEIAAGDPQGWQVPILMTVAERAEGVEEVIAAVDAHRAWSRAAGVWDRRRRDATSAVIGEIVLADVRRRIGATDQGALLAEVVEEVVALRSDPYTAADSVIARLDDVGKNVP